ncbi:hypothetical protein [Paenibacillus favisporus]|nr:hypothetical protein [Paenibacillus favisporus]
MSACVPGSPLRVRIMPPIAVAPEFFGNGIEGKNSGAKATAAASPA